MPREGQTLWKNASIPMYNAGKVCHEKNELAPVAAEGRETDETQWRGTIRAKKGRQTNFWFAALYDNQRSAVSAEDGDQNTRRDCGTDDTRHVRTHGVHQ